MLSIPLADQQAYQQSSKPAPTNGVVALLGLPGNGSALAVYAARQNWRARSPENFSCRSSHPSIRRCWTRWVKSPMIIGNFKNALENEIGPTGLGIPVVIFGHNFTASSIHTAD